MTKKEKKLINKLMQNKISKEYFLQVFPINIIDNPTYIQNLLEIAYKDKEANDIEYLLIVGFKFNLFTEDYTNILCRLLLEQWHYQHENIARILQILKMPESIDCLYKTAKSKFKYLEYNDSSALAVKCIWVLGEINTDEAREKLKLLTQSKNQIISDNAKYQLNRNR